MMPTRPGFRIDASTTLPLLRERLVNYEACDVEGPSWHVDQHRVWLPSERPGSPEADGVWQTACRLVAGYEFSPPELVRAVYDPDEPLLQRTMLLEGRFVVLRLYLGVRVTTVTDERRAPDQQVWGFGYQTLQGHLERGQLSYEVVKHEDSGRVEFVITARSQRAPTLGPIMRLGWVLFGRRRQLRFYRRCGQRMQQLVGGHAFQVAERAQPGTSSRLVLAPSDARAGRLDRLALSNIDPG